MSIPIKPMLAKKAEGGVPKGNYMYETKWDGMRVIVEVNRLKEVRLWTRRGLEVTDKFPELLDGNHTFKCSGIFDGEICCFDEDGKSNFRTVVGRRHNKDPRDIKRRSEEAPATVVLFDVLDIMGKSFVDYPWQNRRRKLECFVLKNKATHYRISKVYRDGNALWNDTVRMGLEGIMAKDVNAPYYPGKRRRAWLKVKVLHLEDVLVTGFTAGEGKREGYFGSLIITDPCGKSLGNVGTGFTDDELKSYMEMFHEIGIVATLKPDVFRLEAPVPAEVRHMERTVHGALREPVFMRFRTED